MVDDTVAKLSVDEIALIEQAARDELDKEMSEEAKTKLKASFRRIENARKVVANLEIQHKALLRDLRAGKAD